jgi:hypothetical protein
MKRLASSDGRGKLTADESASWHTPVAEIKTERKAIESLRNIKPENLLVNITLFS